MIIFWLLMQWSNKWGEKEFQGFLDLQASYQDSTQFLMSLNKGEWFGLRQMCYPPICGVSLLLHNTITLLQTFTTVHRLPTDYQNRERYTNFPQKSSTWKITNQVLPAPMLLNSSFWISSSHFFQLCICSPGTKVQCQIEVSKHLPQELLGH